jgi:hypothetical protein
MNTKKLFVLLQKERSAFNFDCSCVRLLQSQSPSYFCLCLVVDESDDAFNSLNSVCQASTLHL